MADRIDVAVAESQAVARHDSHAELQLEAGHRPKIELLAPAGGPDQFRAALSAGADAIYCGFGNSFNARRSADNFDDESFEEACRLAHLAGARVFVTLNIVISDAEMADALHTARRAWELGADALIVQDWGLLSEIHRLWPEIECHVSTQANVHDRRGVRWAREQFEVERVTLSRELSLEELRTIAQEGVDLECFVHGAICVCYSGLCLMSSFFGGRSANRGLCAQPCRLPFELLDETGKVLDVDGRERLLCPRDMCGHERIGDYLDAGIASLKIEGRMKAPDYVHSVVRGYRAAIDEALGAGETTLVATDAANNLAELDSPDERYRLLKRAFNRDFTSSYLDGHSDNDMMSYERSNNRGELVGSVLSSRALPDRFTQSSRKNGGRVRQRRHTRAELTLLFDAPVSKGDLLEIRPLTDPSQFFTLLSPRDVVAGESLVCEGVKTAETGSLVRVIRSQAAFDEVAQVLGREYPRRRLVQMYVSLRLGEPAKIELSCADGSVTACVTGPVVEAARTRELAADDVREHAGRMGQSAFVAESIEVELDEGCGMSFSTLHHLRAEACEALEREILAPWKRRLEQPPQRSDGGAGGDISMLEPPQRSDGRAGDDISMLEPPQRSDGGAGDDISMLEPPQRSEDKPSMLMSSTPSRSSRHETPVVCALVATPEAARAALRAGASLVYVSVDELERYDSWPNGLTPVLDEISREIDLDRLDQWIVSGKPVCVGNVSSLALAAERAALPELRTTIPVHNKAALSALAQAGACAAWLSPELSLEQITSLASDSPIPVGVMVSGRVRLMTTEHCVLQALGRCTHDCAHCPDRYRSLSMRNIDGHIMPVRTDLHGRSRVYSAQPLDYAPELSQLAEAGVTRFLVDASLLDTAACETEVARIARALETSLVFHHQVKRTKNGFSGHLYHPIG
ncbi:MAG: U32 family peptidase [Atopobiaceae bacterium]|nr:U32 family peptidase [Atopobiaceae bacterium]